MLDNLTVWGHYSELEHQIVLKFAKTQKRVFCFLKIHFLPIRDVDLGSIDYPVVTIAPKLKKMENAKKEKKVQKGQKNVRNRLCSCANALQIRPCVWLSHCNAGNKLIRADNKLGPANV